jgi:ACS family glucarate transporter-like MFS transporter
MGAIGVVIAAFWPRVIFAPREHPRANAAEIAHIAQGGGLVELDGAVATAGVAAARPGLVWELLRHRMLLGIFVAQYCINVLTWFFLTWFPIYLVKERGLTILKVGFVAVLPALCGFVGGVLGGWLSDRLIQRGWPLSMARKLPIVGGLLLSVSMVGCNYVDSVTAVILCMSLAYFGKGVGALGWAVMSDVAPREAIGLSGGLFNTFGNLAGAITPIVIGYLLALTGSFKAALVYVSVHAALAVACYLFVVGEIKRVELPR